MKLGSETGSLVNHMYSRMTKNAPEPEIGMGATVLHWTDRSPATVVEIFTHGKFLYVGIKEDNYKRIDSNGFSEIQEYEYTPNHDAWVQYYRRPIEGGKWEGARKNPETGRWNKRENGGLIVGRREKYHDFSF